MNFAKIERALNTTLFIPSMCELVTPPSIDEITSASALMPFPFAKNHVELLTRYGGSILDEIRIESPEKVSDIEGLVSFANDYNGFVFAYNQQEEVFAIDTDGGKITKLAGSIDDFFNEILLGPKGADFYGDDWIENLRDNGLL